MANQKRKKATAAQKRLAAERAARKARLQWVVVIGVGVLIVGGIIVVSVLQALPQDGDTSRAAWDLPVLDNDPNGDGRISLDEFRGKPIVLNFYADWCTACEAELPAFSTVSNELRDDVHFVHVNSQESGNWHRLVDQFGTDWWPIAKDINGTQSGGSGLWESLGSRRGMPITAFFDESGRWVHTENGVMSEEILRRTILDRFGIS